MSQHFRADIFYVSPGNRDKFPIMTQQKPTIPKGTRDFSPREMMRRNYIFRTIEEVFKKSGYQPLETPAMENLSTLTGKYGEEGDRLLFRILNSGDFLSGIDRAELAGMDARTLSRHIAGKGLRYDLTVPFARFVVQHRHEIVFPFKRYQIQPVWRADRPQKGRYREFYQCDVDVIGSASLLNEAELVQIMDEVFGKLGIGVEIRINNRKILAGIAEVMSIPESMKDLTVAVDKLEKIGLENVLGELHERGIPPEAIEKLKPVLTFRGTNREKISFLKELLASSETGRRGTEELEQLFGYFERSDVGVKTVLDLTLARGLDYYTGTIFEVVATEWKIGSICGGGRYDDLTGIFGMPGISGVGVSFGADRIYDVMLNTGKFPDSLESAVPVLFLNFGEEEAGSVLPLLKKMREAGIAAELYPDPVKIRKQMSYANQKQVQVVVLIGKDEMVAGKATVKVMATGQQETVSLEGLVEKISGLIQ